MDGKQVVDLDLNVVGRYRAKGFRGNFTIIKHFPRPY